MHKMRLLLTPLGSGKTAAFVLPLLSLVASQSKADRRTGNSGSGGIKAIMLAPTRELAEQIHREATRLCAGKRIKICALKKNIAVAAAASEVSCNNERL